MAGQVWAVRLSPEAEQDFVDIVRWTAEQFGPGQARSYRDILLAAIDELSRGPEPVLSRPREEILPGVRTLHVSRAGRRSRHFLMYRTSADGMIDLLRILHDSMDLPRHLPHP